MGNVGQGVMRAPGYDIEPFIPDPLWIKQTWEQFAAGETRRPAGLYSFSREVAGAYRIPTLGVGSGRTVADILLSIAKRTFLQCREEAIDGVSVVTCYLDGLYSTVRIVHLRDRPVRCVCVEPWANTFNLYFFWLGRAGRVRVVYDHDSEEWLS